MNPHAIARSLFATLTVTALLGGCTTTSINTDAAQRTNAALERLDQTPGASPPSAYHDRELRLWQDQPQYAALVDGLPPVKRMRLISAVAPAYPPFMRPVRKF
jgi:hypothetical protein